MSILDWFTGQFTNRNKGMSLYKRGMAKAKRRDHEGAIQDYTESIGMTGTVADVRAMALYNRALVHVAMGNHPKGVEDLDAVLAMGEALVNVKTMARQKLARMESRSRKNDAQNHTAN